MLFFKHSTACLFLSKQNAVPKNTTVLVLLFRQKKNVKNILPNVLVCLKKQIEMSYFFEK